MQYRTKEQWLREKITGLTEELPYISPSDYNEEVRYLPKSVSSISGYLSYDINPFMREIVDCFDIDSPVRELALMKGVQITYSTVLESGALYYMGHVKTLPMMYITADAELAETRIENNFMPMLVHSKMRHIIRSSDPEDSRKTGKTKKLLQFEGGGYLAPGGAKNADKMRSASIAIMLQDEIDAWPWIVGKDGDPVGLLDDRCSGFWERRKIFRGSTPLIKGQSKIWIAYQDGDCRKYLVRCKSCNFPQELRWNTENKETGVVGGFHWETEDGTLLTDSVSYMCQECGHKHYEVDKATLLSEENGAHWNPTKAAKQKHVRSYHLPAFYSPIGMQPWYKCVSAYLDAYDTKTKMVKDIGKYQRFYNNVLAMPFEKIGNTLKFETVSAHRRPDYKKGEVPNKYAQKHCGSSIMFLVCTVDVHKANLAVSVFGVTAGFRMFLIDYCRFTPAENAKHADCRELECEVWQRLEDLATEAVYEADDGVKYRVNVTFVDAGYANANVTTFCARFVSGVYPILGRDRSAKNQTIKEFGEFETQSGTRGYRILVDHYKDRMSLVLRREWVPGEALQPHYHFNAPSDITTKELKELTVEYLVEKTDPRGTPYHEWHRPGNAANELWDLLGYAHCCVEVIGYSICREHFELETVDWVQFWDFAALPENDELFGRVV